MKRLLASIVFGSMLFGASLLTACGSEDEAGICVADMGVIVECFDCWKESDCDGSNRTWNTAYSSCPAAGYTNPTSNECGYTR